MKLVDVTLIEGDEEFVEVRGYNGYYFISNYGRVFSLRSGQFLKGSIEKNGYKRFLLTFESNKGKFFAHRLVASHFVKGGADNLQVNHIDGDKLNNYFKNLEWCTAKENIQHSIITGLRKQKGEFSVKSKLTDKLVLSARRKRAEGMELNDIKSQLKIDCTIQALNFSILGKTWSHVTPSFKEILSGMNRPERDLSKRGESNGLAVLTEGNVRQIRLLRSKGASLSKIKSELNLSASLSAIHSASVGRTWSHVK